MQRFHHHHNKIKPFAKKIKIMLIERDWNQRFVAKIIGCNAQNLSCVILGLRKTEWIRQELAKLFFTTVEELFNDNNDLKEGE